MNNMATLSTRNLSFEQAQAMWPGVTLDPTQTFTFRTEPMPAFETLAYTPPVTTNEWRDSVAFYPLPGQIPSVVDRFSAGIDYRNMTLGKPTEAIKHDSGKPDWSLVPFEALEGMVKVLEFGKNKYSAWNWSESGGFPWMRLFNSTMRHLFAWSRGQDKDPESGLNHIHHAQCNLLFLAYYVTNKEKFPKDDRNVR